MHIQYMLYRLEDHVTFRLGAIYSVNKYLPQAKTGKNYKEIYNLYLKITNFLIMISTQSEFYVFMCSRNEEGN